MSTESLTQALTQKSLERLAHVFGVLEYDLRPESKFGVDLRATRKAGYFKGNEYDEIDSDIKDVANRDLRRSMAEGKYKITTVADYCAHMVRCYSSSPGAVRKVLGLDQ